MADAAELNQLFQQALAAIDAGDLPALEQLLAAHPHLATARLEQPGAWLREKVGGALDNFFARPYLLWFLAEDPERAGRLPANVAALARAIIAAARAADPAGLREQLDYAVNLVAWSFVAERDGVQLDLIDVLADAGAALTGAPENALVNNHTAAAEHLLKRGAGLTLATALVLGRWDAADQLGPAASARDKQFALTLVALRGQPEALRRLLAWGVAINEPSADLYPHATALHHAVSVGSLAKVQMLVAAGADLTRRDTAWDGTPLGWAKYAEAEQQDEQSKAQFAEIAAYLQARLEASSNPSQP